MTSTIAPAFSPHGMVESPAAAIASRLHRSSTGRGGPLSDARAQFDAASRLIGLDPALHAVLSVPQRETFGEQQKRTVAATSAYDAVLAFHSAAARCEQYRGPWDAKQVLTIL